MGERARIALVCSECGSRNYHRTKAKKQGTQERLALKKHCPRCGRHTIHREEK